MKTESDEAPHPTPPSHPVATAAERATSSADYAALRSAVADAIEHQAIDLAARWAVQARSAALRDPAPPEGEEDAHDDILALIAAFAEACRSDTATSEGGVALGLAYGSHAFVQGSSLHHMLRGLDLLTAMTLYVVERAAADAHDPDVLRASAADGIRVCRRVQHVTGMLAFAAAKGYTQAVSDGLRDRFRHLRHDLRNPLGTIKSVLALMDDESIPADARSHPRFRAMAERNARSLDELIVAQLSDTAATLPSLAHQSVSLRTIACAVRRNLRADAATRDVTITVAAGRSRVRVDAVSVELLLHAILLSVVQEAGAGVEITIAFDEERGPRGARAVVTIDSSGTTGPLVNLPTEERLRALVTQMGALLAAGAHRLAIPIQALDDAQTPTADGPAMPASPR